MDRGAFSIRLPFALGEFVYSPDGESLYATGGFNPLEPGESQRGVFKIEFNPVRAVPVPGTDDLGVVSLASLPGRDRIVISGNYRHAGITVAGLFEVNITNGGVRMLLRNDRAASDAVWQWSHLSLSPDGVRASAMRHRVLEIIDLSHGTMRQMDPSLMLGTWSADGKWLATIDWRRNQTILLDAATLAPARNLDQSDVEWSPDSHYLLGVKKNDPCGPYLATLQAIDITTNNRTTIRSSRCKVRQTTSGWISSEITH
jgi:hypothetical protein